MENQIITKKNQIIILVIIAILILGGIIVWALLREKGIEPSSPSQPPSGEEPTQQVFSLSGAILSINQEEKSLVVKPNDGGKEVKVILSDETRLEKLEVPPFDPKNPPKETITPKRVEIKITDFKTGNYVFVKAKGDIFGKTEFNDVEFVYILP